MSDNINSRFFADTKRVAERARFHIENLRETTDLTNLKSLDQEGRQFVRARIRELIVCPPQMPPTASLAPSTDIVSQFGSATARVVAL